jgi:hypothetical protein
MVSTDYRSIVRRIKVMGKDDEVRRRAKELQILLAEPDTDVPYKDAIEMAYNEIILGV